MTGMHNIIASFPTQSCCGMKEIEGAKHDYVNHFLNCVAVLCVQQRTVVVENMYTCLYLNTKPNQKKRRFGFHDSVNSIRSL